MVGIGQFVSSGVWALQNFGDGEPDTWSWFSRFALGCVCLGFAGVMQAIRKSKNNDG